MSNASNKKTSIQNSWTLRYKCPDEFPNIAKFNDEINWKNATLPVHMYFNQEDLKEESDQNVIKDQEYYKRKRKNRRFYRKKSILILEDSSYSMNKNQLNHSIPISSASSSNLLPSGIRFEGQMLNMGFADNDDVNNKGNIKEEAPFRYVLLQFIKNENENTSEINVIPVGDMYSFKKSNIIPDELLTEIDEKIVLERERMKDNILRYKGISSSLMNSEKNRAMREDNGEYVGGFESSSLFGSAVNKTFATGISKKNAASNRNPRANPSGRLSTTNVDGLETGYYMDEEKEYDWCEGDYNTRCADDEEDNIVIEQANLDDIEAGEMSASLRYEAEHEDGGDEDDDEEDEEEEEEETSASDNAGLVDQSIINSAEEARKVFGHINTKAIGSHSSTLLPPLPTSNNITVVKSAMKRSRDSFESMALHQQQEKQSVTTPATQSSSSLVSESIAATSGIASTVARNKVSFNSVSEVRNINETSVLTTTSSSSSTADIRSSAPEYPLTETGVRLFISNRGGKATIKELQFFKPQIKEYSIQAGNKGAGREKFLNILERITLNMEDPILGNVLCLK